MVNIIGREEEIMYATSPALHATQRFHFLKWNLIGIDARVYFMVAVAVTMYSKAPHVADDTHNFRFFGDLIIRQNP